VIPSAVGSWRPSRIGRRLLAFNLLVVFVPVLGVLSLDVYERHLRQAQETAMVQQARLIAAAIVGETPDVPLDAALIDRTFARLERRGDARFRVYDKTGMLIADSARIPGSPTEPLRSGSAIEPSDVRGRFLYRAGAWLVRLREGLRSGTSARSGGTLTLPSARTSDAVPIELQAALEGRYGAATRRTPGQRSVTMFSAVPVRGAGTVIGAVVVSQSTFRILRALYDVRLRVFEIVVASLIAAAALTALAATTIVRPLTRLRRQALALADRRGRASASFPDAARTDELGDLARALEELTRRTNDHIQLLESFSADVSHELKNPIASIRTAAEMMADADSETERRRFLNLMTKDVLRLERLVSGLREVAVVERQIVDDERQTVDMAALLNDVAMEANTTMKDGISIALEGSAAAVRASPERLAQVFQNLVANAASFSRAGARIVMRLAHEGNTVCVTIDDNGPGIPDAHLSRVFDRFFTYRPVEDRRDHTGLGLAIAKQIVESYGGAILASNRAEGGARFEVRLPLNGGST